MMKTNKLFAVIAASILTICLVQALSADVVAWNIEDMDYYYDNADWEEFDDLGQLGFAFNYSGTVDENGNAVYKLFRWKNNPANFDAVECPRQNYLQIKLCSGATEEQLKQIYDKYSEELGYDEVVFDDTYFMGWHNRDENGEYTFNADDVQNKYSAVKKICIEMYKAGLIDEVLYERYNSIVHSDCSMQTKLYIKDYTGDISELQDFFAEYDESFVVEESENSDSCFVDIGVTTDDLRWDISDALEARFPGADASNGFTQDYSGSGDLTSGEVNILTAIQEETACDVNSSGTADLDDAVLVLNHYAQLGAGVAAADAGADKMDVDGDGEVTLDDAAFVVTVYAEKAAGMR